MTNVNEYKIIDNGGITSPKGYKASGIHGGIKKSRKDVAVIISEVPAKAAATFTTNRFAAAPVIVSKERIENGELQAVIINSGNANACTGKTGIQNAYDMGKITAENLGIDVQNVAVSSTGVIGIYLDMDKVEKAIKTAVSKAAYDGGHDAAEAIMTTDTFKKELAIEFTIGEKIVRIGAMAKGSGMIHPNMATMLCYVTTDVNIDKALLKEAVKSVVDDTFNMITIDGDTSTNDTALVLANGRAGNEEINKKGDDYDKFYNALYFALEKMSIMIAKDGEGATKLLTVNVINGVTKEDAKKVAKAIIQSSLVKTAIFGEDANWGRVMAAIGYSNANFDDSKVDIYLKSSKGSIKVAESGVGMLFSEKNAKEILSSKEITVIADLNDGIFSATTWGCDLTFDYVKINASYRS